MRDVNGNKVPSKRVQELKDINDFIREKAAELPPMYEDYPSSRIMLGSEILKSPDLVQLYSKEFLEEIDPTKKYSIPGTESRRVDHYKRMKNLLKKKGIEGVTEYYKQVIVNVSEVIANPVTIGGIKTQLDYGNPIRNF